MCVNQGLLVLLKLSISCEWVAVFGGHILLGNQPLVPALGMCNVVLCEFCNGTILLLSIHHLLSVAFDNAAEKLYAISVFTKTLSMSEFSELEVLLALRPQRKLASHLHRDEGCAVYTNLFHVRLPK